MASREDKVQTYNFNSAPFIADKNSIEQGYATSEPFAIAREGGFTPNVFLLADHGYETYATTIETRRDLHRKKSRSRAALRRGLDHRLDALPLRRQRAANALIKRDNPT